VLRAGNCSGSAVKCNLHSLSFYEGSSTIIIVEHTLL
jgi:hypothetical protein